MFDLYKYRPQNIDYKTLFLLIGFLVINFSFGLFFTIFSERANKKAKLILGIIGDVLAVSLVLFFLHILYLKTNIADYEAYEYWYNNSLTTSDKGFDFLQEIGRNLGLSFGVWRILVYSICFGMIYGAIKIIKGNVNIVFACYAIYPFILDGIQMRNFIVSAIMILALAIFMKWKWPGKLALILGVLIGCQIHSVAFFYLLLLLVFTNPKAKQYHVLVLFALCVVFIISITVDVKFRTLFTEFLTYIGQILKLGNSSSYLDQFRFTPLYFVEFAIFVFCAVAFKLALKGIDDKNSNNYKYIKCIFYINVIFCAISLVILPYSLEFNRIYRNILILDYCAMSFIAKEMAKKPNINLGFSLSMLTLLPLLTFISSLAFYGSTSVFWNFFKI